MTKNTAWVPASTPPELHDSDYGWLASDEILAYRKHGGMCVATYEMHDEDEPDYRWYTADSERWDITDSVTHWMPLPDKPQVTPGCTHDRLITLGTSMDGLEDEHKCLDCGQVLSTLNK